MPPACSRVSHDRACDDRIRNRVVVCGAGAAGIAAALAAAQQGIDVALVEAAPRIGGTVANALIHTLAGFFDGAGQMLNGGLPSRLVERLRESDPTVRQRRIGRCWVLNVYPTLYQRVVEEWVRDEPRISVECDTSITACFVERQRLDEIEVQGPAGRRRLAPTAVVDATGTGVVTRLIDPALIQEGPQRSAGGLIVSVRGVAAGSLVFPRSVAIRQMVEEAVQSGRLPMGCRHAWLDQGVREDEVYVKMLVPIEGPPRAALAVSPHIRRAQTALVDLLQRLPGFGNAYVDGVGKLATRDGGRALGEDVLTRTDVRRACRFEDAICRSCWPIEYWDADHGVTLEYLPPGGWYEIPLRALKLKGVANVWVAGKCLSADQWAQASARVVGSCWAMGEAAGRAAASEIGSAESRLFAH